MYLVSYNRISDLVFLTERHRDMCRAEQLFDGTSKRREFALRQRLYRFTHPTAHHTH